MENEFTIMYVCDRKKCENCDNEMCHHTTDITHAIGFKRCGNYFVEKMQEDDEDRD